MPVVKRPAAAKVAAKDVAPPAKRAKAAGAEAAPAKAKDRARPKAPKADPIVRQVADIVKGFNAAGIPHDATEMLKGMLPFALAPFAGEREKQHQTVIDMAMDVLGAAEAHVAEAIEAARAAHAAVDEGSARLAAAAAAASEALACKDAEMQSKKLGLAEDAKAFRAAKEAVAKAASDEAAVLKDVQAATARKERLMALEAEAKSLAEGSVGASTDAPTDASVDASAVGLRVEALASSLTLLGLDASMLAAVPNAFGKPTAARGAFDAMVISQVMQTLAQRILSAAAIETEAEPRNAAAAAEVATAKAGFEKATAAQLASARAFQEAKALYEAAEAEKLSADKAVRTNATELRGLERKRAASEGRLVKFREGPLATFLELRDRAPPAPEAPPEALPEAQSAAEAAAEPAAGVAAPAGDITPEEA